MDNESCTGHDDRIFEGSRRNKNSDAKKKYMTVSRKRTRTKKGDEKGVIHVALKDQKAEEHSESSKSSQKGACEDIQSSDGYLENRCCTRKFVNLVSTFNSEKVKNVRQLGLDGLLKIQCQTLKNQLILELANKFDVEQCELHVHGGRLKFTVKDIEKTLGLPSEGEDVGNFFGQYNAGMLCRVNIPQNGVKVSNLCTDLQDLESGEEFQAKFFLYAVSTIIAPSSSTYISNKYLGLLNDMSKIRTMNWAKYTLEYLKEGILNFQGSSRGTRKRINGCILMLQIFYLEHISVGYPTLNVGNLGSPSIQYWNSNDVGKVYRKVLKLGGIESEKVKLVFPNDMDPTKIHDILKELQDLRKEMVEAKKYMKVQFESCNLHQLSANIGNLHNHCGVGQLENAISILRQELRDFKSTVLLKLDNDASLSSNFSPSAIEKLYSDVAEIKDVVMTLFKKGACMQKLKANAQRAKKNAAQNTSKGLRGNGKNRARKTRKPNQCTNKQTNQQIVRETEIHSSESVANFTAKKICIPVDEKRFTSRKDVVHISDSCSEEFIKEVPAKNTSIEISSTGYLSQTDLEDPINDVCDLIFEEKHISNCEEPCKTNLYYATMDDLFNLKPGRFVFSMLIDVMAHILTLEEKKKERGWTRWYMPARFQQLAQQKVLPKMEKFVACFRRDEKFMTRLGTVEHIIIPINDQNLHWYLLDIDLKQKKGMLYDTCRLRTGSYRERMAEFLLELLDRLFSLPEFQSSDYSEVPVLQSFPIVLANTFQQPNGFDCGVYVLEYMRHAFLEAPFVEEGKESNEMRREVLAWLLLSESNLERENILKSALKRKRH